MTTFFYAGENFFCICWVLTNMEKRILKKFKMFGFVIILKEMDVAMKLHWSIGPLLDQNMNAGIFIIT